MALCCAAGKSDTHGIAKETGVQLFTEILYAQTRICSGKREGENSLGFLGTNGLSNPDEKDQT